MPWVPKPGAVRRWRDFHKWTVPELCKRTRVRGKPEVSERTIRMLESEKPQAWVQDAIVRALAKALSSPTAGIICHPEFLATWHNADGTTAAADPKLVDPTLPRPAKLDSAPLIAVIERAHDDGGDDAAPSVTKRRTLTERAAIEREIARHDDVINIDGATFPVVGLDRIQEIDAAYADYADQTLAIVGAVEEFTPIPERVAVVLDAERGRGAGYCKIVRTMQGVGRDGKTKRTTCYATVYASKGEHGKALLRAHRNDEQAVALVRVMIAERNEETGWLGFMGYEGSSGKRAKPTAKPWAFVAQDVITGRVPSLEKAPHSRKTAIDAASEHVVGDEIESPLSEKRAGISTDAADPSSVLSRTSTRSRQIAT